MKTYCENIKKQFVKLINKYYKPSAFKIHVNYYENYFSECFKLD